VIVTKLWLLAAVHAPVAVTVAESPAWPPAATG
jgi:hypothetical protein